jgi:preprotein translocase subunit YajC
MIKKNLLYLIFLMTGLLSTSLLTAQTIKGVVTDQMLNETLPGANVIIEGTTMGTITDMDGSFSLEVAPGSYTVVFSYVGYTTERIEVTISANQELIYNISLYPRYYYV